MNSIIDLGREIQISSLHWYDGTQRQVDWIIREITDKNRIDRWIEDVGMVIEPPVQYLESIYDFRS